jgi:CelD/BcsL family acetyltransferase involved in cellulose biosynthesis
MLKAPAWKLGLRGEVLGRDALSTLLPAWEDLCRRSVEENVYYSPRYACALLESVERETDVAFAVVWGEMRLVALLPLISAKMPIPLLRPAGRAWQTKYTFGCMPLLDRQRKTEAAAALVEVLASISAGEWIIPTMNVEGEACQAMLTALAEKRLPWQFVNRFQRAGLEGGGTFEQHMQRHVSAKRRKEIARNRRRLAELGKVAYESHSGGEELHKAVSAFLAIEASGWKGRRGTALACEAKTRTFATKAFTGGEADSICRADVLTLNGMPIAASLIVLMGRTGFTVKCSYDENYRSYGAGLLLETEVIRSFLSENWADRLDSATAGAHVIDDLWPGRIEVADLMFSLSSRASELRLSALQVSEQIHSSLKDTAKQCLTWLRTAVKSDRGPDGKPRGGPLASQHIAQAS